MRKTLIIGLALLIFGCSEQPVEVEEVQPMILFDREEMEQIQGDGLLLNPNATCPVVMKDFEDEQLDGYYVNWNGGIYIDPTQGRWFSHSVLVHEFCHRMQYKSLEEGWSLEERIRLAKLILSCAKEYNDPESEFEIVTHENYTHFLELDWTSPEDVDWWILREHKETGCSHCE